MRRDRRRGGSDDDVSKCAAAAWVGGWVRSARVGIRKDVWGWWLGECPGGKGEGRRVVFSEGDA